MIKTIPLEPGSLYHIYNRGNNKETLFREHENYLYFLKLIIKYILPVSDLYCYCLLTNHFHLVVKIKEINDDEDQIYRFKNAEQQFSNLFNAYARAYNIKYNRTGKLFQERFKRKKIDSDDYLEKVIYYVHANAQLHKVIADFRDYPYSSYATLMNAETTKLERMELFRHFGGKDFFEQFHLEKLQNLLDSETL